MGRGVFMDFYVLSEYFIIFLAVIPFMFIVMALFAVFKMFQWDAFDGNFKRYMPNKGLSNRGFFIVVSIPVVMVLLFMAASYVSSISKEMEVSYFFRQEIVERGFPVLLDDDEYKEQMSHEMYFSEYDYTVPPLNDFLDAEFRFSGESLTLREALEGTSDIIQFEDIYVTFVEDVSEGIAHTGKYVWENKWNGTVRVFIGSSVYREMLQIDQWEIKYNQDIDLSEAKRGFRPKYKLDGTKILYKIPVY